MSIKDQNERKKYREARREELSTKNKAELRKLAAKYHRLEYSERDTTKEIISGIINAEVPYPYVDVVEEDLDQAEQAAAKIAAEEKEAAERAAEQAAKEAEEEAKREAEALKEAADKQAEADRIAQEQKEKEEEEAKKKKK